MQYLKTRWSDSVGDHPLPEYPRPQFRRENYLNLNGIWDCCFTETDVFPEKYDQKILVLKLICRKMIAIRSTKEDAVSRDQIKDRLCQQADITNRKFNVARSFSAC